MFRPLLFLLLMTSGAAEADPISLRPADVAACFVTPDRPALLRWEIAGDLPAGPVECTLRDYEDRPLRAAVAQVVAENTLELQLSLAVGFYELEIPRTKQRFGIVALPKYTGRKDPFFCIDSALSWLERDGRVRQGLIRGLERCGVAMSRERLNWADISRARDRWNWEGSLENETVRRLHHRCGVKVLEMFHGATPWSGTVGKYPEDLVGTAKAWGQIGRRWQFAWGALEVWNEPDIHFGAHLPADQYVPLVNAIAWGLRQQRIETPLVGGAFALYNQRYLDCAARNGLLDRVDAISFHTYGHAWQIQELVEQYRGWLKSHQHASMPLWITECGQPWKRGPDRPPANQDAASALDITMKAVEARATGIARHFPFVYPFYEEREWNFGMMGRRGTPLRCMAAYAQMIRTLAHTSYLGDLQCDDPSIRRARVFGDPKRAIAVLYTGKTTWTGPQAAAKVKLPLPVLQAEAIDGRPVAVEDGTTVPVPDGLVYLRLDRSGLAGHLQSDTPAMKLWQTAGQAPPRQEPSPVVMRLRLQDNSALSPTSEGYQVSSEHAEGLPLQVRVFNLARQEQALSVKLAFAGQPARTLGKASHAIHVPAEGFADVSWQVDLAAAFAASSRVEATITATANQAQTVARLALELIAPNKPAASLSSSGRNLCALHSRFRKLRLGKRFLNPPRQPRAAFR